MRLSITFTPAVPRFIRFDRGRTKTQRRGAINSVDQGSGMFAAILRRGQFLHQGPWLAFLAAAQNPAITAYPLNQILEACRVGVAYSL